MKAVGTVFAALLVAALGGIGCELVVQVDTNQIPLPTKADAATSSDADAGTDAPDDAPDDAPTLTPDTADD